MDSKRCLLLMALAGAGCAPLVAACGGGDDSGSSDDGGGGDAGGADATLGDAARDARGDVATTGDANHGDGSIVDATTSDATGTDAAGDDGSDGDAGAGDASDAAPDVYDAGPPCSTQNPCAGTLTCCSGACVDTKLDPKNCGGCGVACTLTQFCNGVGCNEAILSNVCANARATVALNPYAVDDDAGIALGNSLAKSCTLTLAFADEYDGGVQEPVTNRPITGAGNTFVECGGSYGQSSVAYLDGVGLTTIYSAYPTPNVELVDRKTDAAVVDVATSTLSTQHDYFFLQLTVEPVSGTLCLSAIGLFAPGTIAASYWFENVVAPSLAAYTDSWYVVEWTDGNGDSIPNAGDSFNVIAHGVDRDARSAARDRRPLRHARCERAGACLPLSPRAARRWRSTSARVGRRAAELVRRRMGHRSICAVALFLFVALVSRVGRAEVADDVARAQGELVRARADPPITSFGSKGSTERTPGSSKSGSPARRASASRAATSRTSASASIGSPSSAASTSRSKSRRAAPRSSSTSKRSGRSIRCRWSGTRRGRRSRGSVLGQATCSAPTRGSRSAASTRTAAGTRSPRTAIPTSHTATSGARSTRSSGTASSRTTGPTARIIEQFDMVRLDVEYALGWTLWDRVSPAWTGAFRLARVGTIYVPGIDPPVDATVALQGLQLTYSDRRYRGLYDEGLHASAEVQHAFPLDGVTHAYSDVILDVEWAHAAPITGGFIDVHARAFDGTPPVVLEERLGGLDGSRTLPGSGLVAANRYVAAWFDYQIPFFSPSFGTATAGPWGEVGRYADEEAPGVTYGGPGLGLRFFLKQVAIPVLGVDGGYEVGSGTFRFSVSVGVRPLR